MKVLDLFSGIGGFSLGLERAGFETAAFCEIEEYPKSILKKHWPETPIYSDIRKLTKEVLDNDGIKDIGLICGGFPCQPFSVAGKQAGKEDDRHLWPEMLRLIKEVRPRWVIGENVAGFIAMALDDVLLDLEGEGYETQPFVIPACAVGGIHRRDRVWIVAHSNRQGESSKSINAGEGQRLPSNSKSEQDRGICRQRVQLHSSSVGGAVSNSKHNGALATKESKGKGQAVLDNKKRQNKASKSEGICSPSNVANAKNIRSQRQPGHRVVDKKPKKSNDKRALRCSSFQRFRPIQPPSQPPVRHRNDGLPNNVARLKALGNAVVPQIPEIIGRQIMEIENQ